MQCIRTAATRDASVQVHGEGRCRRWLAQSTLRREQWARLVGNRIPARYRSQASCLAGWHALANRLTLGSGSRSAEKFSRSLRPAKALDVEDGPLAASPATAVHALGNTFMPLPRSDGSLPINSLDGLISCTSLKPLSKRATCFSFAGASRLLNL